MGNTKQNIITLRDLLDYDTIKFTSAEIQLKNILSGWIAGAGSLDLKTILQKYLSFVEEHILNMETFISSENINSISVDNRIMKALIEEAHEKIVSCADQEVKDAGLLASVQLINHFKTSMYGTAAAFAKITGMENFAAMFHEAEQNEKQIDDRLSHLAAKGINLHADAPFVLKG